MAEAGERFAFQPWSVTKYLHRGHEAHRPLDSNVGWIKAGKSTEAVRQEIADQMCTITETAVITQETAHKWRVDFKVTHRIVPIDEPTLRERLLGEVSDEEYADLVNGRTTLRELGVRP